MRNYEILQRIYKKCPDFQNEDYDFDELYECCLEIKQMIAKERPAITKGKKELRRQ